MDTILGQSRAVDMLQRALAGDRVHHAWIFHGPAGVGKVTTALRFARVLLCPHAQPDLTGQTRACGSCESCRLIDSPNSAHPDLHLITKELARYHSDPRIRERRLVSIPMAIINQHLHEPASRSAVMSHCKVFIVDEAELLTYANNPAANTMLKVLEEPPDGTFVILVTSKEHQLLPTIRSRAQRVGFGPLSDADVTVWLTEHARMDEGDGEQKPLPTDRVASLTRFARGSLGAAQLAMAFDLDQWVTHLEPMVDAMSKGRYPADLGPTMADLVNAFADAWTDREKGASKTAANQAGVRHLLGVLGEISRARLAAWAEANPGQDPDAAEAATAPWLAGIELMRSAERDLAANVSIALLLDNLAVQWGRACRSSSPVGAAR